MPPEPEEPGSPAHWLRHARGDLAYATAPLPPGGLLEIPCFHAQQAAEKSIKAVLIALEVSFPRTHNLKTLLEWLPDDVELPEDVEDAAILTEYAVSTRYPSDSEPIDDDEYRKAVEHARCVLRWAEAFVAGLGT